LRKKLKKYFAVFKIKIYLLNAFMTIRIIKNSVLIRVNKFLLLFTSFIFISILIGHSLFIQKSLNEMNVLSQQIKIQLDLLEKKQNLVSFVAHSAHSNKPYWAWFWPDSVDPVLVAVVVGVFIAGCYLGSQGFFSYTIVTEKDSIPSFPSPSSFKKVITDFDVDYTDIGYRIHTTVDSEKGVAHFISKFPNLDARTPLEYFLQYKAGVISTSTESTIASSEIVSSEIMEEATRNALLIASYVS